MQTTSPQQRGLVARALVVEDAQWLVDTAKSASPDRHVGAVVGLSFIGHFSRVVFEGSRIATSVDPHLGVPVLFADLLTDEYADVIERARHATKLLDDNKKSMAVFETEVTSFLAQHRAEFTGNAVWWAQWAETDLSVLQLGDRVLMGSIPNQLRYGLGQLADPIAQGPMLRSVSERLGGATLALAALTGHKPSLVGTLNLHELGAAKFVDRRSDRYLSRRFDRALSEPSKLLLLLVEGEVNIARSVLPLTQSGHDSAVVRAKFIVTVHALNAIQKIIDTLPAPGSAGTERVRLLLAETASRSFTQDPGARQVRNQAVHYRLRDDIVRIDPTAPMFGLVEQLWNGHTFEQLQSETASMLRRLSEVLHDWRTE